MRKNIMALLLTVLIFIGITGCSIVTSGKGSWEIYCGVRTEQSSEEPAKIEIKSSIVDFLTDEE